MTGRKFAQHLGNLPVQQGDRTRYMQATTRFDMSRRGDRIGGIRLDENRLPMGVKLPADFRHDQTSRRTMQQTHRQTLLECSYPAAERRFRQAERAACRRKAAMIDRRGKVTQIVQVTHEGDIVPIAERSFLFLLILSLLFRG
ncbi:MAG TPA: hypothetical protein PKY22_04140 [Accumulibacter sp.]|nr:hypothetical protein [Accumulibacter sp.]